MKPIYKLAIPFVAMLICFSACNNEDVINPIDENNISDLQKESERLYLSIEDVKTLTVEEKERRLYSIIIAEHTILKENNYFLDVTEKEALNLGVPSYYYREAVDHLNTINDIINQAVKKGSRLNLVDMHESVTKLKQQSNYKSISRGEFYPDVNIGILSSCGKTDTIVATHRDSKSFVGTLKCNVDHYSVKIPIELKMTILTAEAISPNFTDSECETFEIGSFWYFFHLKVKPNGLTPTYMITFYSYPCTAEAHWTNQYI